MINPIHGIGLHALGGISASACYLPFKGTAKWSWQTYWLVQAFVAWALLPLTVACLTVPELFQVISETPSSVLWKVSLLGACYGFGGMAFGVAIGHIGFSLTYCIAIGISAVFGTVVPELLAGTLIAHFQQPGGLVILLGFALALIGVAFCAYAGVLKERSLKLLEQKGNVIQFNIRKGLPLVIFAGLLSAVFGLSLAQGVEMDVIAAEHGAGQFQGNAKYIFAMGGCFLVNFIWWICVCIKKKTLPEFYSVKAISKLPFYYLMAFLGGSLWYSQFFFYGLAHTRMGDYGFISWGIHMAMLIFFSYVIGLMLKEWSGCNGKTRTILYLGLGILFLSFALKTYGSTLAGM